MSSIFMRGNALVQAIMSATALFGFVVSLLCFAQPACAGDAPGAKPAVEATAAAAGKVEAKKKDEGPFASLAAEEKWIFDPPVNRQDIFYDLETMLASQLGVEIANQKTDAGARGPGDEIEALREWAKRELVRIEGFIFERKWDDALKATEADLKKLQPRVGDDSVIAQITEKMKRYRSQAEEAKIYEEAQAKFDALGLRVEGILWSPAGSLAVINGEPRARAINERVKDCVIINIDTNRVDFLFHYNRRRFEFQRYVGEDAAKKPGQTN
jgi:hypothetical protein